MVVLSTIRGALFASLLAWLGARVPATLLQSSVKAVVSGGQWLVSGGSDDLIHLYDLKVGAVSTVYPCALAAPSACSNHKYKCTGVKQ